MNQDKKNNLRVYLKKIKVKNINETMNWSLLMIDEKYKIWHKLFDTEISIHCLVRIEKW